MQIPLFEMVRFSVYNADRTTFQASEANELTPAVTV